MHFLSSDINLKHASLFLHCHCISCEMVFSLLTGWGTMSESTYEILGFLVVTGVPCGRLEPLMLIPSFARSSDSSQKVFDLFLNSFLILCIRDDEKCCFGFACFFCAARI